MTLFDHTGEPLLSVAVPWTPKAKGRPRHGKNGHVFTPKDTKEAEASFRDNFKALLPDDWEPIDTPVAVDWTFANDHVLVEIRHHPNYENRKLRADLDNYVKLVSDALNEIAYVDDRLIVATKAVKL